MKPFTTIAAAIFLLMGLVHVYRIAAGIPITFGDASIGQNVSWAALITTLILAAGLFREALRMPTHDITLVAELNPTNPKEILVTGKTELPKGSGGHHFKFTLDDRTAERVQFASLTSADDCSTCPPDTTKPHDQIYDDATHNNDSPRWATFKNKNNNKKPKSVPMDVSYQWEFTCDDPTIAVLPFDPILKNGGKT